ncbi:hypothetical protein [Bacillus mycoides]|uniref:hypothetical protein n=1 Tax=Bacillus mycoides TaxID=1405 RepID=UPI00077A1008|nr:hypothetical protein [Bacillus mycoides]KXY31490.1 hypothetical protein AT269_02210 [Bacillus cereus]QWG62371.1 hypothetical protein EXW60_15650 [Bacillus mycoides]QWG88536.1 hypothetical protein EXW40_04950 [Bacillus mycoides]QWJ07304.1 hypothetical protein J5V76_04880 [Bacillus mycoides]
MLSAKKCISSIILTTSLVSGFANLSQAEENISVQSTQTEKRPTNEAVTKTIQGNVFDLGDQSITQMSEVLTFEELADQIAKDTNSPKEKIIQQLLSSNQSRGKSMSATFAATYRTISDSFTVTRTYKPSVRFYCETTEGGGSFRAIREIKYINMNRSSNGMSKAFGGTVQANLEDPNRIFYIVNGDFYNNGSTTVNGGVSITLGQYGSVNFGASSTSNHFKYTYVEDNAHF